MNDSPAQRLRALLPPATPAPTAKTKKRTAVRQDSAVLPFHCRIIPDRRQQEQAILGGTVDSESLPAAERGRVDSGRIVGAPPPH